MTDRFELQERVGRGGMGTVWKARDRETGGIVALKLLHPHLADDPAYLARFEREVEIARRIDSPNVVKTLGFGEHEEQPFIAMEFVEGQSLKEVLKDKGKLTWDEARPILQNVLNGLHAAHDAGVIHRDIKPGNIIITNDGTAKVADFGIARAADLTALTGTSTMLGTPQYMAPDNVHTPQSDLYSLGCVAFEMLTGSPPFEGDSQAQVIRAHVLQAPPVGRISPPEAQRLVEWLLRKEPGARPGGAAAALAALNGSPPLVTATEPQPTRQPRFTLSSSEKVGLLAVVAVLLGSLGLWAVAMGGGDDRSQPTASRELPPTATVASSPTIRIAVSTTATLSASPTPKSDSLGQLQVAENSPAALHLSFNYAVNAEAHDGVSWHAFASRDGSPYASASGSLAADEGVVEAALFSRRSQYDSGFLAGVGTCPTSTTAFWSTSVTVQLRDVRGAVILETTQPLEKYWAFVASDGVICTRTAYPDVCEECPSSTFLPVSTSTPSASSPTATATAVPATATPIPTVQAAMSGTISRAYIFKEAPDAMTIAVDYEYVGPEGAAIALHTAHSENGMVGYFSQVIGQGTGTATITLPCSYGFFGPGTITVRTAEIWLPPLANGGSLAETVVTGLSHICGSLSTTPAPTP